MRIGVSRERFHVLFQLSVHTEIHRAADHITFTVDMQYFVVNQEKLELPSAVEHGSQYI